MDTAQSVDASLPLSQDAEAFRLLVSNIRDYGILLIDINGYIVGWHAGATTMTGYSSSEAIGEHVSRFFTPDDNRRGWPQHVLAMAEAQGHFEVEGWRVRKDGSRFWVSAVVTALRDSDGKLRGFATLTHDVTEKRRQEQALQRSEERLRSVIEGVRDYAIFTLDPDGTVTSWNAGAREIKGYEADEIIGSHFSRFYTSEAIQRGRPQHVLAMAREQGRFEDEGWRVRKDGSRFWANVVISALRNSSGDLIGFSKVTRDLTERRRREEALNQSEERARQRGEALEDSLERMRDFIAMLSHELRNPLAPIRTAASLMAHKDLDPTLDHLRQTIDRQTALLSRIVDDLLDINRIERGQFSIKREPVLLSDVLKRAVEASLPVIEGRGHTLQTQLPMQPIELLADTARLSQVFINLLNNAARYTEVGGEIRILVETSDAEVTVRVADTGKGIAPELLARVFFPFTQLEPRDKDSRDGLGLGLALVQRIVQLHGGTVQARSDGVGHGSEFVVTLPLITKTARPVLEERREVRQAVRAVRILCVDDDQAVANGFARLLEAMGHTVRVAFDGASALREAQTFRPELALLDIDMPGMDGYEIASRLREQQREPPPVLVALTGWGLWKDKEQAQEAGFHRYLVKPVTEEALESLLAGIASVAT
jgi:PAS domain S-box-containing protein